MHPSFGCVRICHLAMSDLVVRPTRPIMPGWHRSRREAHRSVRSGCDIPLHRRKTTSCGSFHRHRTGDTDRWIQTAGSRCCAGTHRSTRAELHLPQTAHVLCVRRSVAATPHCDTGACHPQANLRRIRDAWSRHERKPAVNHDDLAG